MSTESTNIPQDEQKPVETTEAQAQEKIEATPDEKRSPKRDENFRRMEKKVRELEEKVRQTEEAKQRAPTDGVEDTDLLTVGQMKKLLEEQMRSRELSTLEDRLNAKFPDYNQVVSEDAVEELRENHPEVFNSLKANPDPYQKAVAAYKLIKTMAPKADQTNMKRNQQKIEENKAKPQMAASAGSVLSQATGWSKPSKEQKAAAYAEMKSMASRRG